MYKNVECSRGVHHRTATKRRMNNITSTGSSGRSSVDENDDEDFSKVAIASFRAREEEIERKKMEIKEKIELQLGRAEDETRRLAQVWEELEVLTDPMQKEVATVRKKIDAINKEVKALGHTGQKKEREYREVWEAFQEKTREKNQLTTTLLELVRESEMVRMKKLEELSKIIGPTR